MSLTSEQIPLAVCVVGHDRTRMTIENILQLNRHIKYQNIRFFVCSDRSRPGHIEAIRHFTNQHNIQVEIFETPPERFGLGSAMNIVLEHAFEFSDVAMLIENDMIIHRDIYPAKYIQALMQSNIGNIGFRYFSKSTHKCNLYNIDTPEFVVPVPISSADVGYPADFGQNIFSKRFIKKLGPFLENENDAALVEKTFVNTYAKQLGPGMDSMLKVIPVKYLHELMNDPKGVFFHIGIFSQHNKGVEWNRHLIPQTYHFMSDDKLDEAMCSQFAKTI